MEHADSYSVLVTEFSEGRVAQLLADDAYAQSVGVKLVEVTPEQITVSLEVEERHANFLGVGHGGMVFSLADCAFSLASNAAGARAVAIDTHLVLSGAARVGDRLEATIHEVTRGRTLGTYRANVTRDDGRVIALFTGTVHITAN